MSATLWGRASSVNVQKVIWAAEELGLSYTRIDAGGSYGQIDTAAFAALNPNRRVPVWQEDGLALWESHAILRHLAAKAGRLQPGPVGDQWMEFTTSTLQPPFIAVFFQTVRLPVAKRSAEVLARQLAALDAGLDILETRLIASAWLGGSAFSVADIAAGALMYRYGDMDIPRPERPGLARWVAALRERPAYRAVIETSYEELRAPG